MSQIKLTIAVSEKIKNDLISEAKMNNMTLSELCRAKLSQEYKTERITNNQIYKLTDKCYRLITALMLINYGGNAIIDKIDNLNEERIERMTDNDNFLVSAWLEHFVEKEKE